MGIGFVDRAWTAYIASTIVEIENARWDDFSQLVMPDLGAVDIFEVQALPVPVPIVMAIPLIGQFIHVAKVMTDRDGHVGLLGQIASILIYSQSH